MDIHAGDELMLATSEEGCTVLESTSSWRRRTDVATCTGASDEEKSQNDSVASTTSGSGGSLDDSCRTPEGAQEEHPLGRGRRLSKGGEGIAAAGPPSPVSVVGHIVEFSGDGHSARDRVDPKFSVPFRIHIADAGDSGAQQGDSSAQQLRGETFITCTPKGDSAVPAAASDADSLTYSVSQEADEYGNDDDDCSVVSLGSLSYSTASDAEFVGGGIPLEEDGFKFCLD